MQTNQQIRHMIDAAKEANTALSTAWAEMGRDAARQLQDAQRLAVFESRMEHIEHLLQTTLRQREVLEAKIQDAPEVLARVYRVQLAALDTELGRLAGEGEALAQEQMQLNAATNDAGDEESADTDVVMVPRSASDKRKKPAQPASA